MSESIYSFVSKGLLTETALDRAGRRNALTNSQLLDERIAEKLPVQLLDQELLLRARRMATVYSVIAAFENSVRDFISKKLLEVHGASWWSSKVSEKIRVRAESRREEEAKIRWHTPRGDQPLNYTELGDLTSIVGQNWTDFEPHLISQDWTRQILLTVERSRNVIMHSGELGDEDVERLGSAIRDWVVQVGA